MPKRNEAALAEAVIAWLTERGWTIYQEVDCRIGRADIVAVRGPLVHAIECKSTFGFAVLDQAHRWIGHANLVSVATEGRSGRKKVCDTVCEALGIGRYSVPFYGAVHELVSPRLWRRVSRTIRNTLRPEHQDYARAGTNGGYYSAWRGTCAKLAELVNKRDFRDGLTVKEAVAQITHHYATDRSARACLLREAQAGKIPGVVVIDWYGQKRFAPAKGIAAERAAPISLHG